MRRVNTSAAVLYVKWSGEIRQLHWQMVSASSQLWSYTVVTEREGSRLMPTEMKENLEELREGEYDQMIKTQ